ncbi:MAG: DUF4234 domain-containing protein, partial [Treponema sp.]|nr:DUF4234 domain-containing protein [Treponema sp.]
MNTNFLTIIKRIVSEQGESILANPQQLKGLISDYAKDEPKPERLAFGRCIEYGAYTELKNAPPGGRAAVKNRLAQRLHSGEGLDPALCAEALDLLEAALFGTLSAAGQNTAPPPSYPSSAPVPASSAYQPSQPPAYQPSAPAARISYQVKMRGLASYIIFGILTLGIYQLYWYYKLAKDVNLICAGDLKKTGGLAKQIFFG